MKMIFKAINGIHIINRLHNKIIIRHSALFINGMKATDTFVYLTPYIDFPERIKHREKLEKELTRRKSSINLNELEDLWEFYQNLQHKKESLYKKKDEISNSISEYLKTNPSETELESLKIKMNLIKENIKKIKPPLWSAEEIAILEVLKIPNILHPLTPEDDNKVIYETHTPPSNSKNHLNIGKSLDILHFTKNENYYLKNDGAIFELGAKFFFSNELKKKNFVQFSNTDFVKSIIIEGCGENHTDPNSTFILHHNEDSKVNINSRLHLTGAGSSYSFFAYHAKNVINTKALPMKYFAMGRNYKPPLNEEDSLFHVSQSSVIQIFQAGKTEEEVNSLLQELTDIIKDCYNMLGYHYRLSILSADKLSMWESLRISVEMYSSSLKSYVEVGNISISGDFISKRLMFTYTEDKQSKFPLVISGMILNVPKLLACVLEQDGEFFMPEPFKVQNWNM